jgi:hypothetical protein
MKDTIPIFISSKQKEFETERAVLADKISAIPFLEPMLAEEWGPQRSTPEDLFLDQVRQAPIYIGLFHRVYSKPTEMEYRAAVENPYREILIYLKRSPEADREAALKNLIAEFEERHVVYEFTTIAELLQVFTNHLGGALKRLITHLQKLGEGPPVGRTKESVLAQRWARQQAQMRKIELLRNPLDAAVWIERLSHSLGTITTSRSE